MVNCAKCNFWFKLGGSVEGECRCKMSENWKKNTLYCSTCDKNKEIVMPVFFESVAKVVSNGA